MPAALEPRMKFVEEKTIVLDTKIGKLDDRLDAVEDELQLHRAKDEERGNKIDALYKRLVTGNGDIPLIEIVRQNQTWIKEQVEEKKKKIDANSGLKYTLIATICVQIILFVLEAVKGTF